MSQVIDFAKEQCKRTTRGSLNDLLRILATGVFPEKERPNLMRYIALMKRIEKQLNKEKTDVTNN